MKDIILTVDANTRKVTASKGFLGITGENLTGNIVFDFKDEFIDGTGYLEIDGDTDHVVEMTKIEHRYSVAIQNSLLSKVGRRKIQLKVITPLDANTSRIFKSQILEISVYDAINADAPMPDEYPTWEEAIEDGLSRIDETINDLDEKVESGYFNGTDGEDGKGIVSITKTETSGLVDTYTIVFTDGTSTTFTVTNGVDGAKIISQVLQGQDENGGNIYLQTFDDGHTETFTAPRGLKGDSGIPTVLLDGTLNNTYIEVNGSSLLTYLNQPVFLRIRIPIADYNSWDDDATLIIRNVAMTIFWKIGFNQSLNEAIESKNKKKYLKYFLEDREGAGVLVENYKYISLICTLTDSGANSAMIQSLMKYCDTVGNYDTSLENKYSAIVTAPLLYDTKKEITDNIDVLSEQNETQKLQIENIWQALKGYIFDLAEESHEDLKSAILPSSVTVDNSVYPISDGTRALLSKIKGNTKQFNQPVLSGDLSDTTKVHRPNQQGSYIINNGVLEYTYNNATAYGNSIYFDLGISFIPGHNYFVVADCSWSGHGLVFRTSKSNGSEDTTATFNDGTGSFKRVGNTFVNTSGSNGLRLYCGYYTTVTAGETFSLKNVQLFDLTAMGLDSITTIEEFTALYPKAYYPYNAGTLYDSVISGVSLAERNLIPYKDIDETLSNVRFYSSNGNLILNGTSNASVAYHSNSFILPQGTYYLYTTDGVSGVTVRIRDENDEILATYRNSFTLSKPTSVYLNITFSSGVSFNNKDMKIMLSNGSTATPYEPYVLRTISLPSAQTLGGARTAQDEIQVTKNTNDDYYTITKTVKVKRIDLSTLTFTESGGVYSATISDIKSGTTNILLSDYTTEATINGATLEITTSSTPTGNITYELATPVETTLTETATLAEVSAIRENGGMISVVGNTNEDYAQPDVSEIVVYQKANGTAVQ